MSKSISQLTSTAAAPDTALLHLSSGGIDYKITVEDFRPIINNDKIVKVSLTAAQIKTGNSVPIDAIAAPGAGYAIDIISAYQKYNYGTVAFTSTYAALKTETATSDYFYSEAGTFDGAVDSFTRMTAGLGPLNMLVENKKVRIVLDSDSAVGDGDAEFYILYRIITL